MCMRRLLRYLLAGTLGGGALVLLAQLVARTQSTCTFFCKPEIAGTAGVLAGVLSMVMLDLDRRQPTE